MTADLRGELKAAADALAVTPDTLPDACRQLADDIGLLRAKLKAVAAGRARISADVTEHTIGGIYLVTGVFHGIVYDIDPEDMAGLT